MAIALNRDVLLQCLDVQHSIERLQAWGLGPESVEALLLVGTSIATPPSFVIFPPQKVGEGDVSMRVECDAIGQGAITVGLDGSRRVDIYGRHQVFEGLSNEDPQTYLESSYDRVLEASCASHPRTIASSSAVT